MKAFFFSTIAAGRGCLSRGRRSTQGVLDELRRAWPPLGPRLPFVCGRCSTQSRLDKLLLRVAAAGAAAAFRVAGAVHRASWRGRIARVRRCFCAAVATHHSPFITHHVAHLIHHLHSSRLTYHSHSSVTTSHISLIIHHSSLHHISLPLITVS